MNRPVALHIDLHQLQHGVVEQVVPAFRPRNTCRTARQPTNHSFGPLRETQFDMI